MTQNNIRIEEIQVFYFNIFLDIYLPKIIKFDKVRGFFVCTLSALFDEQIDINTKITQRKIVSFS